MPRTSWPQRVHLDVATRSAEAFDPIVISTPTPDADHRFLLYGLRGTGRPLHDCASRPVNVYFTPALSASTSKHDAHSTRHRLSTTVFHALSGSTRYATTFGANTSNTFPLVRFNRRPRGRPELRCVVRSGRVDGQSRSPGGASRETLQVSRSSAPPASVRPRGVPAANVRRFARNAARTVNASAAWRIARLYGRVVQRAATRWPPTSRPMRDQLSWAFCYEPRFKPPRTGPSCRHPHARDCGSDTCRDVSGPRSPRTR